MAKSRLTGRGAVVQMASSTGYLTVGLTRAVSMPPQEKGAIDCTAMEDTYVVVEQGMEQQSMFTFQSLHASTDTADAKINTDYANAKERKFRVRLINGSTYAWTTFDGLITAVRPQSFTGSDPITREVQVVRTSAVLYTT